MRAAVRGQKFTSHPWLLTVQQCAPSCAAANTWLPAHSQKNLARKKGDTIPSENKKISVFWRGRSHICGDIFNGILCLRCGYSESGKRVKLVKEKRSKKRRRNCYNRVSGAGAARQALQWTVSTTHTHTTHFLPLCLTPKHSRMQIYSTRSQWRRTDTQKYRRARIQYTRITCYSWLAANLKLYRKWAHGSDMKWTPFPLSFRSLSPREYHSVTGCQSEQRI